MYEALSLRVLFVCTFLCLLTVVFTEWTGDASVFHQTIGTLFVIGLASLIIWMVTISYRLLLKLRAQF